jgi:hypothetical protein
MVRSIQSVTTRTPTCYYSSEMKLHVDKPGCPESTNEVRPFIIVILLEVKKVLSRQQKRVFKRKMTKVLSRLEVITRAISDLKVNPKTPRQHSPRQIRQIAGSIESFHFVVPALIDRDLTISAGHGRVLAAQLLGWNEVPTILLDHLTEAQAAAFAIADNRLPENSSWDSRLLAQQLKELSILNLNFGLEVTGFEIGEIDFMIEQLDARPEGEPDPADQHSQHSKCDARQSSGCFVVGGEQSRPLRRCAQAGLIRRTDESPEGFDGDF